MTIAKLACPKCSREVPEVYWQRVDVVRCPACEIEFEQLRFPSLAAARQVDQAAALVTGEANCYFHAQNRAEVACDGCGRYVCAVCRVPFAGRHYCPSCLEARADRRKLPENQRVLYSHIALVLAILPLIIWPFTLLTAPAALAFCFYGWKKPGSLLPQRRKLRFIIAGVFATLEIAGWLLLFGKMILR
jgi:hypothetical protein